MVLEHSAIIVISGLTILPILASREKILGIDLFTRFVDYEREESTQKLIEPITKWFLD